MSSRTAIAVHHAAVGGAGACVAGLRSKATIAAHDAACNALNRNARLPQAGD